MKKLIFIGLSLGFIFAASETASAQFCKPNANQVAIFLDWRYEGHCKILNPGNYPTPQSMGMANDSISSIMVGANVNVELCADNNFQGACQVFNSNNDFLGNTRVGNDNASSMRVVMRNNPGGTVSQSPAVRPPAQQPAPRPAPPPPSNLPPPTDEVIYVFKNKANVTNCTPNPGWAKCIQLVEPTIRIMATKAVSQSAMNGVANVYTEMTRRFNPRYAKSKLDTFIVHLTNAEPWSELINLAPIGMAYPQTPYDRSGDWLRGYGNPDNLWITEQMICKQGVKTRNDKKPNSDNESRTFDQVIHEFGHSIHSNYFTDQQIRIFDFQGTGPLESFPFRIMGWFRSPDFGPAPANQDAFLKQLFTARATFSCDGYRP